MLERNAEEGAPAKMDFSKLVEYADFLVNLPVANLVYFLKGFICVIKIKPLESIKGI
jgi:hypothetical protein